MGFAMAKRCEISAFFFGMAVVFVAHVALAQAPGGSGKALTDATPEEKPLREFIYYPNYAQSPYNYQSTGDFAGTPMVIPSSVPIIRQPSHYIVEAPQSLPPPPPAAVMAPQRVSAAAGATGPAYASSDYRGAGTFSLHVGSSMDPANAGLLVQQVNNVGVQAYRRPMSYNGLSWEQIHAGPFDSYEKTSQVARLLQDQLQIQGKIVSY